MELPLDPNNPDTDGDGIPDGSDIVPRQKSDYEVSPGNYDIDGDGIVENDFCAYYTDCDGDGLFDNEEKGYGTDPRNPDTDGDGLIDWYEVYSWSSLKQIITPVTNHSLSGNRILMTVEDNS